MPINQRKANLRRHIEKLTDIIMTYEIRIEKGAANADDIRELKYAYISLKVAKTSLAKL